MAKSVEKVRKKHIKLGDQGDPIHRRLHRLSTKADEKIAEKGGFIETNLADTQREAKATEKKQQESIRRQEQQEKLQLAESEDEIKRRKLLKKAGGRRSLIASR